MISRTIWFRSFSKDKIFLFLAAAAVITAAVALSERRPSLEHDPTPFGLGSLFAFINFLFAFLALKREPLLAYMFLTATIVLNGSLFFFFRYLTLIQVS